MKPFIPPIDQPAHLSVVTLLLICVRHPAVCSDRQATPIIIRVRFDYILLLLLWLSCSPSDNELIIARPSALITHKHFRREEEHQVLLSYEGIPVRRPQATLYLALNRDVNSSICQTYWVRNSGKYTHKPDELQEVKQQKKTKDGERRSLPNERSCRKTRQQHPFHAGVM